MYHLKWLQGLPVRSEDLRTALPHCAALGRPGSLGPLGPLGLRLAGKLKPGAILGALPGWDLSEALPLGVH